MIQNEEEYGYWLKRLSFYSKILEKEFLWKKFSVPFTYLVCPFWFEGVIFQKIVICRKINKHTLSSACTCHLKIHERILWQPGRPLHPLAASPQTVIKTCFQHNPLQAIILKWANIYICNIYVNWTNLQIVIQQSNFVVLIIPFTKYAGF